MEGARRPAETRPCALRGEGRRAPRPLAAPRAPGLRHTAWPACPSPRSTKKKASSRSTSEAACELSGWGRSGRKDGAPRPHPLRGSAPPPFLSPCRLFLLSGALPPKPFSVRAVQLSPWPGTRTLQSAQFFFFFLNSSPTLEFDRNLGPGSERAGQANARYLSLLFVINMLSVASPGSVWSSFPWLCSLLSELSGKLMERAFKRSIFRPTDIKATS